VSGISDPDTDDDTLQLKITQSTDNLLVLFELQELKFLSNINLALCILSLFYVAINIVGLDWNSKSGAYRDASEVPMHLLEFWSTLVFALVEVCSLVYSPKSLKTIARNQNTTVLKCVVFMNVATASTAALLYSMDPVNNEVPSHEIEYVNELCVAFVDFLFIRGLMTNLKPKHTRNDGDYNYDPMSDMMSQAFVTCAFMFTIVQLFVYNLLENGEQDSHWMEVIRSLISNLSSMFLNACSNPNLDWSLSLA